MTIFAGNICADAVTKQVTVNGTPTLVTNFNVAHNKAVGGKRITTFYRISLWREAGAKLSQYLKKGRCVELYGDVYASAYIDKAGKAQAQLEMANPHITFLDANPTQEVDAVVEIQETEAVEEPF